MAKPGLPQGMRDFSAETVRKRNFILDTITGVMKLYGYQPLETPAMENLDTLLGKYGEEGDKLIFKVLNNGLHDPKNAAKAKAGFEKLMEGKNTSDLTERALKYDLTIPFARYVAMNSGNLTMPFKRYQVQPVWRADRPQRGRYREFTQCDADVVGSRSLINEVELSLIYHTAFTQLGIPQYRLKINSRKILTALAQKCGGSEKINTLSIAIDKLDKIGLVKVKEELLNRGFTHTQVETATAFLELSGSNEEKLEAVQHLFENNEWAAAGISEIQYVLQHTPGLPVDVDLTLARGLDYYTGIIFEAKAPEEVKIGSIGGGGRYDDLTGLFGLPGITGVGISFGIDRIYDVLEEMNLFPASIQQSVKALLINMGAHEADQAFQYAQALRTAGIACELYPESIKLDKQLRYADKKHIPFAIILGALEIASKVALVKDLATGHQEKVELTRLVEYFSNK